jgi:hypothetical protein
MQDFRMRKIILFFKIVWREWEPKGTIPEPYRIHYRLSVKEAWRIAKEVHGKD